jgi:hypothetical protein
MASWFVPPIEIPVMLAILVVGYALYGALVTRHHKIYLIKNRAKTSPSGRNISRDRADWSLFFSLSTNCIL